MVVLGTALYEGWWHSGARWGEWLRWLKYLKTVAERYLLISGGKIMLLKWRSSDRVWYHLQALLKAGFILSGSEEEVWGQIFLVKPDGFILKTNKKYLIVRVLWRWSVSPHRLAEYLPLTRGFKEKLRDLVKINVECWTSYYQRYVGVFLTGAPACLWGSCVCRITLYWGECMGGICQQQQRIPRHWPSCA